MIGSQTKGRYPSTRALTNRLRRMLAGDRSAAGDLEILHRLHEPYSSSFPSEIVTCRLGAGRVKLLCKHARQQGPQLPAWHTAHGHRHGLGYEGLVYRHILEPLRMTTPRLWGTHAGPRGRAWLAVEYLDGCMRLKSAPSGLKDAAAWIGRFHTRNESRLSDPDAAFLRTYTADYYRGWARRTVEQAREFRREYPRIEAVSETFEHAISALLDAPLTVIHGEFYPSNVLWRPDGIYPVDWETAAIAAGEIDLASLTEHWPADAVESCETSYGQSRWPGGWDQRAFRGRLAAARLYLALRWAAVPGALAAPEDRAYYLDRVASELDRMDAHVASRGRPATPALEVHGIHG